MAGALALETVNRRGRVRTWALGVCTAALLIAGASALPQPTDPRSARMPTKPPPAIVQPAFKLALPTRLERKAEVGNYYYSPNWIGDIGADR